MIENSIGNFENGHLAGSATERSSGRGIMLQELAGHWADHKACESVLTIKDMVA